MPRPKLDLDEYLPDPLGTLAKVRRQGWIADAEPAAGVLRYDDVRTLLSDGRLHADFPDFLRSFGVSSGPFFEWMSISPLNRDGEEHRRWRAVMSRTFTPRRVEQIRPFLQTCAGELVSGFAARGQCDFMAEYADSYPSLGLCELIGVPLEDRDQFRDWANTIGLGFSPIELLSRIDDVDEALTHLLGYTTKLVERRSADPRDDLVTKLALDARQDGWSKEEVAGSIAGLVFAGHETTKNQLGWMVASLSERADLWEGVADGSIEVAALIEEIMRFRSAITGTGRTVAERVEYRGETFEPATRFFLSLWSANHDETIYEHPETIDIEHSKAASHIAFGLGPHHCLGAALARTELQESLLALTRSIECPKVGSDATWKPPIGINGPQTLPITFSARV